jgi:hypothetical protein
MSRIAAQVAVKYVIEKERGREQPRVSEQEYRDVEKLIFRPVEKAPVNHVID